MYAPSIIERNIASTEQALGLKLRRYSPAESLALSAHISDLLEPKDRQRKPVAQSSLTAEFQSFIQNEILMCRLDWSYWLRYVVILQDGGGAGPLVMRESQRLRHERYMIPAEEQMWEEYTDSLKHSPDGIGITDGIRITEDKARQLYATTSARLYSLHRAIFYPDMRTLTACADEDQLLPLYDRDDRLINALPPWMRPSRDPIIGSFDVKGEHIYFGTLRSSVTYYSAKKKGGVGQGDQFPVQHKTELAFWGKYGGGPGSANPEYQIDFILKPTLPQSIHTLDIEESTANGRGTWWHVRCEEARKGHTSRRFIFMPWYVVTQKRRRNPPSLWQPDDLTLKHADKVLATSAEWTGRPVTLDRTQLYWWESERKEMQKSEGLWAFYASYPATPEESFQASGASPFPPEMLERWELEATIPRMALELVHKDQRSIPPTMGAAL